MKKIKLSLENTELKIVNKEITEELENKIEVYLIRKWNV